jgi:hypothetical protein
MRYHWLSEASPGDHVMIISESLSSGGVPAGVHTGQYQSYARRINIGLTSFVHIFKSTLMTPFLCKNGGSCNYMVQR